MVGDRHPRAGCCCGDATVETTQRDQVLGLRAADRRTGSVIEELPQLPGVAGSSVQGIVPRRFAAISLRSAGSQTRTVSAWASATSAVIAAGLGATTWWRSSLVTIISSKSPPSPSAPAIQFAFMILTRHASSEVLQFSACDFGSLRAGACASPTSACFFKDTYRPLLRNFVVDFVPISRDLAGPRRTQATPKRPLP